MAFWSRNPRKQGPGQWLATQARHLHAQTEKVQADARGAHGVTYVNAQAAFDAYLPTLRAQERLAAMAEALRDLAMQARVTGAVDGYFLQEVDRLCEYIMDAYKDAKQSCGLLLYYPEDNGRLVPSNATVKDWERARAIGDEARARFDDFWRIERRKYDDAESGPAAGYRAMMRSYTEATGRPATRSVFTSLPPGTLAGWRDPNSTDNLLE